SSLPPSSRICNRASVRGARSADLAVKIPERARALLLALGSLALLGASGCPEKRLTPATDASAPAFRSLDAAAIDSGPPPRPDGRRADGAATDPSAPGDTAAREATTPDWLLKLAVARQSLGAT